MNKALIGNKNNPRLFLPCSNCYLCCVSLQLTLQVLSLLASSRQVCVSELDFTFDDHLRRLSAGLQPGYES